MLKALFLEPDFESSGLLYHKLSQLPPDIVSVTQISNLNQASMVKNFCEANLLFIHNVQLTQLHSACKRLSQKHKLEVVIICEKLQETQYQINFRPLAYISPPFLENRIRNILTLAEEECLKHQRLANEKKMLDYFLNEYGKGFKIGVPTSNGLELFTPEEIVRCEGFQTCTRIITKDRKDIISSYNIGEFRKLLEGKGFFASHRSHLINLAYVKSYKKSGTIILKNGTVVPLSHRKRAAFLKLIRRV